MRNIPRQILDVGEGCRQFAAGAVQVVCVVKYISPEPCIVGSTELSGVLVRVPIAQWL